MNMEGSEERLKLQEERRQRKKEKRKSKQAERQHIKLENQKLLEVKSQGNNICIVTSTFKERLTDSENSSNHPQSVNLSHNEFPLISEKVAKSKEQPKPHSSNYASSIAIERNVKKHKDSICIPIEDLLQSKPEPKTEVVKDIKPSSSTCSNPLDSSKPLKKIGKHKEVPKEKKVCLMKQQILQDLNTGVAEVKSFNYSDNNIETDDLNASVIKLLERIVELQEKMYKKNPDKAVRRRRYVSGLHEVKKNLSAKRIKILIFATDMQVVENGILHKKIEELKNISIEHQIPYIFALKRKKLGKLCLKNTLISCIGILNYDGANEFYHNVIAELEDVKIKVQSKATTDNSYTNLLEKFKSAVLDST